MPLPYRDFHYPLNVFMHLLTREEGQVRALHYGLFDSPDEPIRSAQERSTELLLSTLPPPPARVLDVGIGIATTLARLIEGGWDAEGITPDEKQVVYARLRHGDALPIFLTPFESFEAQPYDCVVFQESSQYIDSDALFARAAKLTKHVVVLDEFATRPLDAAGSLHDFDRFVAAAASNGFAKISEVDVGMKASHTISYFLARIPQHRAALIADLGLDDNRIDELLESGAKYRELYLDGTYTYRLLEFRA